MSQLTEFAYQIMPKRENFMETITPEEQEIMGVHFNYLKDLLAQKRLVLAGPCTNAAYGIVIYLAESPEEAQKIAENDPAIVQGVMRLASVNPFHTSLLVGRDS